MLILPQFMALLVPRVILLLRSYSAVIHY